MDIDDMPASAPPLDCSACLAPTKRADLTSLYGDLSPRLEQILRRELHAPDAVVEDACQFAWTQLAIHDPGVRGEAALSWLTQTASREAFRLVRRRTREPSLEAMLEVAGERALPRAVSGLEEAIVAKDRLGSVRALSVRQQRLLWLHAIGLSYVEMARHEGCTRRTVERQLLRAKGAVRAVGTE